MQNINENTNKNMRQPCTSSKLRQLLRKREVVDSMIKLR